MKLDVTLLNFVHLLLPSTYAVRQQQSRSENYL